VLFEAASVWLSNDAERKNVSCPQARSDSSLLFVGFAVSVLTRAGAPQAQLMT
jgi:hypothetical protein